MTKTELNKLVKQAKKINKQLIDYSNYLSSNNTNISEFVAKINNIAIQADKLFKEEQHYAGRMVPKELEKAYMEYDKIRSPIHAYFYTSISFNELLNVIRMNDTKTKETVPDYIR